MLFNELATVEANNKIIKRSGNYAWPIILLFPLYSFENRMTAVHGEKAFRMAIDVDKF